MGIGRDQELFSKAVSILSEYAGRQKKSTNEHTIFCAYGVINMMHKEYKVEKPKGYITKKSIKRYDEYIKVLENSVITDKKKAVEALQAITEAKEYLSLATMGRIRGGN